MRYRPPNRSGTTLIELLIGIVILAILATAVYPSFQFATENAEENKHKAQPRLIRSQIQLYRIQHGGALPDLISSWDALTKTSTYRGRTYGPYLDTTPVSQKRSNVFDGNNVDPPGKYGFVYDYQAGAGSGATRQLGKIGRCNLVFWGAHRRSPKVSSRCS
jgi:prepilin-type N-terminal cleavage/methylation domain-containing protein